MNEKEAVPNNSTDSGHRRTPARRLTADDLAQTVGGVLLRGCCPQGCSGCTPGLEELPHIS